MKKKNMSTNYGKSKSRSMRYEMNSSYSHGLDAKIGKKILTSVINEMKRNKQDSNEGLTYSGSKGVVSGDKVSGNNMSTDGMNNGPIKSENSSNHSGSSVHNEKNGTTGYVGANISNYNSVNNFYGSQQYKNNKNCFDPDYNPFGLKKIHDFKEKNCNTNKKYGIHRVMTNGGMKSGMEKMSSKEDDKINKEIMSEEEECSKSQKKDMEKLDKKQMEQLDDGGTEVSLLREELSLRMLKNIDEHTVNILVKSSFVTLYKMKGDELKWQRANIEGFLYIVRRSTTPMYRLIITNKRNENHLIQDVDEHIHVTTTNNYIFYKVSNADNSEKSIYSLWFFSDEEKDKIYKLLKKLIQNLKESGGVLENKEPIIDEVENKEENQENEEENEEDPCILNKSKNYTINEIPVSRIEEEQISSKIHNFLNATDVQMSRSLDMSTYHKHSSGSGKGNSNGNSGWAHTTQVTKKSSSGYNWLKTKTLNDINNAHSNGTEENIISVQSNSEDEYGGQTVLRNGTVAEDTYLNQMGNNRNYHTNGIACSGISKAAMGKGGGRRGEIGTGSLSSAPKVDNFQRSTEFNEKAGKKLLYLIKGISHEDPEPEANNSINNNNNNNNKNDTDNNNNSNSNNNNSNSVGGNRRKHRGEFYDSKEISKRMNEQKLYHNEPSAKSGGETIMNLLGLSKNNSVKEDMTYPKKNGSNGGMLEKNECRGKRIGQKLKDGKSIHNGKTFINYFNKQNYESEEEYKENVKDESHNSTNHMMTILSIQKNKESEKNWKQVGTCASINSNQEEPKMMTLLDVIKSKSAKMAIDENVKKLNDSNQIKNNNSNEGKYNVQNRNMSDNDVLNCYNTDPFNILLKMQSKIENEDIIKKMTEEIEDVPKGKKKRVDQIIPDENNIKELLEQETSIYGERNDIGTKSTHKFKITNTEIDVGLHENMHSIRSKNEKEKREDWAHNNECLTLDQNKLFNIIKETLQSDEFINLLWKNIKMNNFT